MAGEPFDLHRGCARAREWASLRIDSELSELERLLLRRHLSRCDGCRAFADALAAATKVVRATPIERPSRALEPVPPRAPRARRLRYGLVAAAAAAMVAAGVSTAVLVSGDGRSPGQTRPVTDVALRPPVAPPPPGTTFVEPPRTNV